MVLVVCVSGLFCLMGVMRLFSRKGRKAKTDVSTKHVLKPKTIHSGTRITLAVGRLSLLSSIRCSQSEI